MLSKIKYLDHFSEYLMQNSTSEIGQGNEEIYLDSLVCPARGVGKEATARDYSGRDSRRVGRPPPDFATSGGGGANVVLVLISGRINRKPSAGESRGAGHIEL